MFLLLEKTIILLFIMSAYINILNIVCNALFRLITMLQYDLDCLIIIQDWKNI